MRIIALICLILILTELWRMIKNLKLSVDEDTDDSNKGVVKNSNPCLYCGEEVPEGRHICPKCEKDLQVL